MTKKTDKQLVAFAKSKLGVSYVYGMKGTKMTQDKFNQLRKLYPSIIPSSDKKKVGKICTDCSGLISWCTGIVRGSSNYYDTAVKRLPIKDISKAVPGCALWQKGHVGIYIGDGYCIEARGSKYGVVKTKVKYRKFTHILWLKDVVYSKAITTTPPKVTNSYYPKCSSKYKSLVDALKSIKINSSFSNRKKIAKSNGVKLYVGSSKQNTTLLNLLKNGKLKKA